VKLYYYKIQKKIVVTLPLGQGCIFWPLPAPLGGGEIGTFGSLGKKIDPSEEKNLNFTSKCFFSIFKKYKKESSF